MHLKKNKIRLRIRDSIIQSLRAGVTPKIGLEHIQVGRANEIKSILVDIERIIDGGAAFRLIVGEYGSGKSFFLQLTRQIALSKGLVTVHADLSPERRIHATGGQARNLYAELMRNISTRTKPDGNAMKSIVEKFITKAKQHSEASGEEVHSIIRENLAQITEFVGGYDFSKVIESYWLGYQNGDQSIQDNVIRWLRGEFTTKTDARKTLGVRSIISDGDVYDHFKLMSLFVRQAGYKGLLICIDEMVNLYKLSNTKARTSNYEQLLRILNDCLQGSAEYIGFLMGGTPDFLYDPRRGLYSYEALRSRLAENSFSQSLGTIDYSSTTLPLANLTPEELYLLLCNLRHVYASGDINKYLVPDEALEAFLAHCNSKIGEAYFRTPRNTIKAFLDLLAVLEQNDELKWNLLIQEIDIDSDKSSGFDSSDEIESSDDDLANFKL